MQKKKSELIMNKYLDETLAKQSQVIISAVVEIIDKKTDALALKVAKGFENTVTKDGMEKGINNLALKVAKGFNDVEERMTTKIDMDNGFVSIAKNINLLQISLEKRFDGFRNELKTDINGVHMLMDGYVKTQEDFKDEFEITKEEVKQIKEVVNKKFKIEIKAI